MTRPTHLFERLRHGRDRVAPSTTVVCDRCGLAREAMTDDAAEALRDAALAGWTRVGERDYCRSCTEWERRGGRT